MIDHHCHLLPGIDDGARDRDEALAMAGLLAAAGFEQVCCTPHRLRGSYDTTPEQVRSAVDALQEAVTRAGIDLQLHPGMEYYLDEFFLDLTELVPLGTSRLVLVEAPGQANAEVVAAGLDRVLELQYLPLVAHPERSSVFHATPALLTSRPSVKLQANIGSFVGFYGPQVQRKAYQLLREGRYARLGSDAHDACRLPAILEAWQEKLLINPVLGKLSGEGGGVLSSK